AGSEYTVVLTITDDDGATDETSETVNVVANQPPSAMFGVVCIELTCNFTDGSTDADGTIVSWAWNFGDLATSSDQSPSHTYAEGGDFTVTLTVTDDSGATDEATETASPNDVPVASFDVDCTGSTCMFTDTSTDEDGTIEEWEWDFGDGDDSDDDNPTHRFTAPDDYTVELTVTDDAGERASVEETVSIGVVADF
ncbi:MAG: PKD domain-containing protein, partial [Myxococcales bacterium]|nr:PKD domain-containing protein [Myxococcales bacterium]